MKKMSENKTAPIAVFDSGIGGLSFLAVAQKRLAGENFIFYADLLNAPYGEKSPEWICKRLTEIFRQFCRSEVKAVVIACNTATSAAVQYLRQTFTDFPILGMEPAIQLAAKYGEKKAVVLSTPLTARGANTLRLANNNEFRMESHILACPGLMELVENQSGMKAAENRQALIEYLHQKLDDEVKNGVEAVILGCTHYIFLRWIIKELFPKLHIYDGNEGTLNNLCHILSERDLLNPAKQGGETVFCCSDRQTDFAKIAAKSIARLQKDQ